MQKPNRLEKRLHGYQKADRGRFLLLTMGVITSEEFVLYELCAASTDWDRNHENYGLFDATNQELADILHWKANSTASRHMKGLIDKGLIEVVGDRMRVKDFEQWELRKNDSVITHKWDAKTHKKEAIMQRFDAKMQRFSVQNKDYSLGSYKGNVGSFSEEIISDEETERISEAIEEERNTTH